MSLTSLISTDLTEAMKSRQQERLDALRMVHAAFKNEQISLGHELSDDEALKVINRLVKQRREAAQQYRVGQRPERANREEAEAKLLENYLPAQLSDAELKKIVDEVVTQTGATGANDFGKVMGAVMSRARGRADGSRVATIAKFTLRE